MIGNLVNSVVEALIGKSVTEAIVDTTEMYVNGKMAPYQHVAEDAGEIAPYIPGASQLNSMADSKRYWDDYEKNTGKKRRYPGLQTHTPDVGDVVKGFEWWDND